MTARAANYDTSSDIDAQGLIVDARSVFDAINVDLARSGTGARDQCLDASTGPAAASAPVDTGAKPNKLGGLAALAAKLKERTQVMADPSARSQVEKCAEEKRANALPQKGLEHYHRLFAGELAALPDAAIRASGHKPNGTPAEKGIASPTCVRSTRNFGNGASWPVLPDVQLPPTVSAQTPVRAGIELALSVVDQDCYNRTYPNAPIPPGVEVLPVHKYLDRIIESRAARARNAGYVAYASALLNEYAKLKAGGK